MSTHKKTAPTVYRPHDRKMGKVQVHLMAPYRTFEKDIALLQKFVPLRAPTNVVLGSLKGYHGLCSWKHTVGHWLIHLDPELGVANNRETLIHEWAHALANENEGRVRVHGAEFGAAYARCYRAVIERTY